MRLPIIVGLLIAHLAFAQQKTSTSTATGGDAAQAVQLPPSEIQYLGFSLDFSVSKITGKISAVKVTRVETWSAAAKAGLRADDYLTAVNGVAVVGTKYSDFPALFDRSNLIGQPAQYSFSVTRGSKKNRATAIVTFSVKLKQPRKEANQTSEPTAPSGRGSS